jgi:CRISPR-associated protein Cmr3
MIKIKQWCFSPLDTWFFKEARPFDSVGATQLGTILLPPPARTVAGAIRTLIGENQDVNWKEFNRNHKLTEEIGYSDCLGKLRLTGPYLLLNGERLYPVPLILLEAKSEDNSDEENCEPNLPKESNSVKKIRIKLKSKQPEKKKVEPKKKYFVYLHPGQPVKCDLGTVRLPTMVHKLEGAKPIENAWLTAKDFERVLTGKSFPENIIYNKELFTLENRVGLALDRNTRIAKEHQLYQNQHIRIHPDKNVQIGMQVDGIKEKLHPTAKILINFGGEGRLAEVSISEVNHNIISPVVKSDKYIFLTLLTAANLDNSWLPNDSFKKDNEHGEIKGVKLKIVSAVLGKSIREGGWDLVKGESRPVISLIPAGSVLFCEVIEGDPTKLQGCKIGIETALGRGELAVGKWEDNL